MTPRSINMLIERPPLPTSEGSLLEQNRARLAAPLYCAAAIAPSMFPDCWSDLGLACLGPVLVQPGPGAHILLHFIRGHDMFSRSGTILLKYHRELVFVVADSKRGATRRVGTFTIIAETIFLPGRARASVCTLPVRCGTAASRTK